ncbi:hypothetical protein RRG08_023384 [Elysia crispata]|uniref:Uncharacterized protein n=1 Tax=Elysia crispata TaxID=231223 RepID=A0AAE1EEA6_9GAST|nr:hypothetical protein RRG08_023384 [Elysia crispata]
MKEHKINKGNSSRNRKQKTGRNKACRVFVKDGARGESLNIRDDRKLPGERSVNLNLEAAMFVASTSSGLQVSQVDLKSRPKQELRQAWGYMHGGCRQHVSPDAPIQYLPV